MAQVLLKKRGLVSMRLLLLLIIFSCSYTTKTTHKKIDDGVFLIRSESKANARKEASNLCSLIEEIKIDSTYLLSKDFMNPEDRWRNNKIYEYKVICKKNRKGKNLKNELCLVISPVEELKLSNSLFLQGKYIEENDSVVSLLEFNKKNDTLKIPKKNIGKIDTVDCR